MYACMVKRFVVNMIECVNSVAHTIESTITVAKYSKKRGLQCVKTQLHTNFCRRYVLSHLEINKNGHRYPRSGIKWSDLHVHE
jgi:hypothetical protein